MEIRVPVFAGRRILKKESLWDIRDYTYAGWQLYYAEYTDGLLKGCVPFVHDLIKCLIAIGCMLNDCLDFTVSTCVNI